ncbi:MAG: two-component regulator propeller domain-containing protein, partial [Bacteroidota bacterium]
MRSIKKEWACIVWSLLGFLVSHGQPNSPAQILGNLVPAPFENMYTGHSINALVQDRYGMIWVSSEEGIFHFDGQTFRYGFPGEEPNSPVMDREFLSLGQHGDTLYIGTSDGLIMYNLLSHDRTIFTEEPSAAAAPILNNRIEAIAAGPEGMWLGSWYGVSHFDFSTSLFTHFPLPQTENENAYASAVNALAYHQHKVWLGTWSGHIHTLDPQTGELTLFSESNMPNAPWGIISSINSAVDSQLIINTFDKGSFVYHPAKQAFIPLSTRYPALRLSSQRVHASIMTHDHQLWVGTENGIDMLDQTTDTHLALQKLEFPEENGQLGTLAGTFAVLCLLEDDQGGLWIGANEGLFHYHPLNRRITSSPFTKKDRPGNKIISAIPVDQQTILINGLNHSIAFDVHSREYTSFTLSHTGGIHTPIYAMAMAPSGRIYAGSNQDLFTYSPTSRQLNHLARLKASDIVNMVVSDILAYDDKTLYISQLTAGTYTLNLENKTLSLQERLHHTRLIRANQQEIWHDTGRLLAPFDYDCNSLTPAPLYFQINKNWQPLSVKSPVSKDSAGNLYLFSQQGELLRIDPQTRKGQTLLMEDMLNREKLIDMVCDKDGILWILSAKAVYKYNPASQKLNRLSEADGLIANKLTGARIFVMENQIVVVHP